MLPQTAWYISISSFIVSPPFSFSLLYSIYFFKGYDMKKRLLSLIFAIVALFSVLCPVVHADDNTSFSTCTHDWVKPIVHGYSISIPNSDVSFGVEFEQCSKCHWYKHDASLFIVNATYYSPFAPDANGIVPKELITYWCNKYYEVFGKNATAKKYETGGGSAGTGGVGRRPSGYADDKGTPSISRAGLQAIALKPVFRYRMRSGYPLVKSGEFSGLTFDGTENANSSYSVQVSANRLDVKNTSDSSIAWGRFYVSYEYTFPDYGTVYFDTDNISWKLYGAAQNTDGEISDVKSWSNGFTYVNPNDKTYGYRSVEPTFYRFWKPFTVYDTSRNMLTAGRTGRAVFSDTIIYFKAADSPIINQTNITINNNTWNGNIYQDNSTNLTYIYPQYTTINENNETVTNISNNPIIYNNETKQYYTYDTVTNNYYYITYETPTPSPSPDPTPTPDPGTDPTPTPEPGGDTGDTTGILAVLVEIRDNMIQGFADLKATLVQGWADLSANFTLAIENLNLNITNIFNKKFPDQSTPETAEPSPSPSPSPSPEPSPSPTPDPGETPTPTPAPTDKPSNGNTNNFWNFVFPGGNDDGTENGHKGILWALISLLIAVVTFVLGLGSAYSYVFPFLPAGLVTTIHICVLVLLLFAIIKFVRSFL